ncbi:MAG: Stk1 family PASTA domain-containing Ser/Thr kinase [Candidatus Eremiobacteraeota bacterium]|nr:Stk1 family PASTA domain-containing Ser/Thr kinase [Candidatus Eremiobacteraeota bacterium]
MIERNLSERYRLDARIGQGGMAIVYSGIDTVLRRRVAIKVLRPELAADADFVARFYTEAQHAAKLSHPNIVNIYDVGQEGENYFIVMELVDGATLAEMIEKDRRLPEPVAIDFAAQICNGLAYAHRQGLLHRDVKPANILVTKDDVVKISDFGIARAVTTQTMSMTQPGMVMGSVFYISPEQAQGHELHETGDLYSLGIVLYQMLTGKLPYTGESPVTVALKHVSNPVPPVDADDPSISPALSAIVRKLMQKDPAARFPSAVAVAKALREAREHPLVTTPFDAAANGERAGGPQRIPNPKPRPSPHPDRKASLEASQDASAVVPERSARNLGVAIAALVTLALAIVTGYYVTSRPGGPFGGPATIVLPSVVGATSAEAEARLDKLGLRYNVVPVASETVGADRVVRQDPARESAVAARALVQLFVSTGLPTVQLIDVRQYSSDDAERYLRNAKLVPKVSLQFDKSPRGTVLSQRPSPGESVPIHSSVVLVVSKGAQPVGVPDIVSQTLGDATNEVRARHLSLVITERDPNDQIPADTITSQSPQPGTQVDPNSTVNVVVSSGPPVLSVPAVEGRIVADAEPILQNAGLQANIEYVVDESVPLGTVMKQNPERGATARKGSSVTLDVAVSGVVPDVAGKNVNDAQTMLQNEGYKIGNTSYVQESTDGTVARTEPAAGSTLRPGETVMLYVNGVSKEGQ